MSLSINSRVLVSFLNEVYKSLIILLLIDAEYLRSEDGDDVVEIIGEVLDDQMEFIVVHIVMYA